ncbi:DUF805 domain-containing protein [Candidatus Pelagibacter bacterium]|nr:DUF805 domain-containing protein [Candidatus Pelagibacter bacterium]
MIYKFIDNNGSEITVNSLSSLQALVDSETVKEDTRVKAGLRGKWTTASSIEELTFPQEESEEVEETVAPEGDIKSFITADENNEELPSEIKPEEVSTQPWQIKKNEKPVEESVEEIEHTIEAKDELEEQSQYEKEENKSEYELEEEKIDKTYDDENVIGLTLVNSIGTCLKKYFNFRDRASRSEYWYFQLIFTLVSIPLFIYEDSFNDKELIYSGISAIVVLLLFIPAISVSVRRLHDIDKSGWFVLISAIPFIGWIILAIMLIGKGTSGKNRFGEYPLKLKS